MSPIAHRIKTVAWLFNETKPLILDKNFHILQRNELDLVRSRGYALDNEETVIGVQAVAAPIFSGKGTVEGSLSVSGPVIRITEERIVSIMPSVVKAADTITSRLGGDPHIARLKARQPIEKDAEATDEVTA